MVSWLSRKGDFALRLAGALGCIAGRMTPVATMWFMQHYLPTAVGAFLLPFMFGYAICLILKRAQETEFWSLNIGWWELMR